MYSFKLLGHTEMGDFRNAMAWTINNSCLAVIKLKAEM